MSGYALVHYDDVNEHSHAPEKNPNKTVKTMTLAVLFTPSNEINKIPQAKLDGVIALNGPI